MLIRNVFFLLSIFLHTSLSCSSVAQSLDGQIFMIQSKGAKANGRVLEADYTDLGKNGSKVQLSDKKETPHQNWKFEALGDGNNKYYIINQSPKAGKYKYLEAAWTTLGQDGGRVHLWAFTGGPKNRYGANQVWRVIKNNDGTYSILSAHVKARGQALSADSFTQQNNGGKIYLYFDTNVPTQVWNLLANP